MVSVKERTRQESGYEGYGYAPTREREYKDNYNGNYNYNYNSSANAGYAPAPSRQSNDEYTDYLWGKLSNTNSYSGQSRTDAYVAPAPANYYKNNYSYSDNTSYEAVQSGRNMNGHASLGLKRKRTAKKLSIQGKVILAVYLAVVLLIVGLIIVNAEIINSVEMTATTEAVNPYVANADGLHFIASPMEYEVETNWFDSICDGINDLLGA